LAEKLPSAHYGRGCESRYFLRINGHPQEVGLAKTFRLHDFGRAKRGRKELEAYGGV